MPSWGWLVVGIGLLGVEMFVIDAQFYLVFLGASAALVGLLGLAGLLALLREPGLAPAREYLRLGPASRVLVINTEGATDPVGYAKAVNSEP